MVDAQLNALTENTRVTLEPKIKRKRVWELDFLRGLCIVLMIFDHLALLLGDFFGPVWFGSGMTGSAFGPSLCRLCHFYYNASMLRKIGHPAVLFVFFAISGISCTFSRSNGKRGFQLLIVALIYSAASYIGQELTGQKIFVAFGVLDFYAVSILLYALVAFILRNNKFAIAGASAAVIIVTLCLYFLYTPPADTPLIFATVFPPYDFYGNKSLFYSAAAFSPGDLFTMIPWSAFFWFGTLVGPFLYGSRTSRLPILDHAWHKPVSFVGRHALIFYVLHVIVLTALLMVISAIFITPGDFVLI